MKLRIYLPLLILFGMLILTLIVLQQRASIGKHQMKQFHLGRNVLHVEIADTIATIELGLGDRDSVGSDGMLFVMPTRIVPQFWMKRMRFNLDFVWIDQGKVIDLTEHVPAQQEASDSQLLLYAPRSPVTEVLELPDGDIQRKHILIGDRAIF